MMNCAGSYSQEEATPLTQKPRRQTGFTLVELMIVIVIAGILAGMAIPAFQTYQASQQIRSTAQDLVSALNFARSEAIKRKTLVTVAPLNTWNDGWTVAIGSDMLGTYGPVTGVTIAASTSSPTIYNRDGRLRGSAGMAFTITASPTSIRCVKIALSGKPSNKTGACE